MKIKRNFFSSLFASLLFGLIIVNSAFAASIEIGSTDDIITIDEEVTTVSCRVLDETETTGTPTSNGMKCDLTTASGVQTVYYTVTYMNNGNTPASQEEAIRQKLDGAGLLAEGSNPNPDGGGTPDADGNGPTDPEVVPVNSECTSILPPSWCESDGDGVIEILNLILNIMTMGMGILATIGLIIAGIQWLTARDKEDQVVKAKSRIFNIVIGVIVWGIMWLVLSWLLPGGLDLSL